MEQELIKAFKKVNELNPPSELDNFILRRIDLAKNKQIERKLILSRVGLIGSFTAFLYVMFTLGSTFLNSEFWNMLSLSFSDIKIVASYWNDYMLSLLETFPTVTVAVILTPIFTLLLSFGFYLDSYNKSNYKYINLKL